MLGNENFKTVNEWLGWGDPKEGLWFIGMEEGELFTEETVSQFRGTNIGYSYVEADDRPKWPVANKIAKIAAHLLGLSNYESYRDTVLWRKGSRVFNGNILPLGKRSRSAWPEYYHDLFGVSHEEYRQYFNEHKDERYQRFRELRQEMKPQAIVCFGKGFWQQFEDLFLSGSNEEPTRDGGCLVYQRARLILAGHFSRGSAFPNTDLDILVNRLKLWKVQIGSTATTP